MLGEPTAPELVEAVALFLEKVAAPKLDGHAAFHARVALNVLAILQRELTDGPAAAEAERARLKALIGHEGDLAFLRSALAAEIRVGAIDETTPGLLEHLEATAADRVRIEQPSYASLKRVG
ncbi:MAG: DUF6285 domain-containing protein [Caulobacterales bacterium]|jgi:hypothetical protein